MTQVDRIILGEKCYFKTLTKNLQAHIIAICEVYIFPYFFFIFSPLLACIIYIINYFGEWYEGLYISRKNRISLFNILPFGEHLIETSSECRQLCMPHPPCAHCPRSFSVPKQPTLSNRIGPVPSPNLAQHHVSVSFLK